MGTFMESNKRVIVKSVNASEVLQIDVATTLAFYIVERIQETTISTLEYQVEKIDGRTTSVLTAWTSISMVDVTNDIYEFDYTVTGITASAKILIKFKIVDIDGMETFIELNNFKLST